MLENIDKAIGQFVDAISKEMEKGVSSENVEIAQRLANTASTLVLMRRDYIRSLDKQ